MNNSEWTVVRRKKSQATGADTGISDAGRKLTGEEDRISREQPLGQRVDGVGPYNPTISVTGDQPLPTKSDVYGPSSSSNLNFQQKEHTNQSNLADTSKKAPAIAVGLPAVTPEHVKTTSSTCQPPTFDPADLVGNQNQILTLSNTENHPLGLDDIQMGQEFIGNVAQIETAQETKIGQNNSTRGHLIKAQVELIPPIQKQAHMEEMKPDTDREENNENRGKEEATGTKIRSRAGTLSRPTRSKPKGRGSVPASNQ